MSQLPARLRAYVNDLSGFSPAEVATVMSAIHARGDRMMTIFLACHFAVALALAPFYSTWALTVSVSLLAIGMFLVSVKLLPGQFLTRCVAGVSLQAFVALHIYQLHGMPEMHFFFFTAFTMMLVYQDWVCMWPGALLIIGQHILFALLHNSGVPLYFFPESYVGFTKLFFHFGIAVVHVAICGYWAFLKKRQTLQFERQSADLHVAMKKAQEGAEAKSAFLAMMSHEIRTPMNAVVGMTELLLDTPLSSEQRDYAEAAQRGANGLLTVINDVLDFSRIEARKVTIQPVRMDLRALLSDLTQLLAPGAEEKGLRFTLHYPSGLPRNFCGDVNRIRQIAINLIGNAIKYTDEGSVEVRVEIRASSGTAAIALRVVDTGPGIAPEMIPLLFQEFSRLDASAARKHGGTGLGLAIAKRLAALMGGELGLESQVGKGTTFWLNLPLPLASEPEREPSRGRLNLKPVVNARVLLAEDNDMNRRVATAYLSRLGCQVDIAENGAAALEKWSAGAYDMIFMDCQMPELDGYEATRRIRSLENGASHTPVVALTAHAMAGDRQACLDAGMDDYVPKPIDIARLSEVLVRWAPLHARVEPTPT